MTNLEDIRRFVEDERGVAPKELIDRMVEAARTGGDEEKARQWGALMGFLIAMDIKSAACYFWYQQHLEEHGKDHDGLVYQEARRDVADDMDFTMVDYLEGYLGEE